MHRCSRIIVAMIYIDFAVDEPTKLIEIPSDETEFFNFDPKTKHNCSRLYFAEAARSSDAAFSGSVIAQRCESSSTTGPCLKTVSNDQKKYNILKCKSYPPIAQGLVKWCFVPPILDIYIHPFFYEELNYFEAAFIACLSAIKLQL